MKAPNPNTALRVITGLVASLCKMLANIPIFSEGGNFTWQYKLKFTYMESTEGQQCRNLGRASLLKPSGPSQGFLQRALQTLPNHPNPSAERPYQKDTEVIFAFCKLLYYLLDQNRIFIFISSSIVLITTISHTLCEFILTTLL